jgi:hypothetical protein
LPERLSAIANDELRDASFQRAFGLIPYSWAMVELDRFIPYQCYVDLAFASKLRSTLPAAPTLEQLVRFSSGRTRAPPPVHIEQRGGNKFLITSTSSDLRVNETVLLDPTNVQGYEQGGCTSAIIGILVVYSLNVMHAIRLHNRLLLVNGTHRAYALRAHGITHAPCIVRHASCKDDLDLVGGPEGDYPLEWYFSVKRPPLLKDFFDERMVKLISTLPSTYLLTVNLTFEKSAIRTP